MDVLIKICTALNVDFTEIMELVHYNMYGNQSGDQYIGQIKE